MSRKLLFYQNILKIYLRLSILAFSGLCNSKDYQKNEPWKAGERFVKALFVTACARKENERFKIQVHLRGESFDFFLQFIKFQKLWYKH